MAIRGAARAVARAARCGSAGLRPAAPAASETRTAAVFILHWTCVRSVSSSDLVSPAACRDCSPMAQRVVRFCSLVMLSGSLRRSLQLLRSLRWRAVRVTPAMRAWRTLVRTTRLLYCDVVYALASVLPLAQSVRARCCGSRRDV